MDNSKKKVLYFFQSGRKEKISSKSKYAKEMFYGYHYFLDHNYKVDVVEFRNHKTRFGKYFFLIFEKRLRNIFKLPLYWSFVTNKDTLKKIFESDFLIFANNRMACSALPMILYTKIFKNKVSSLSFIMGLFSRTPKYKILALIQKAYIILCLKTIDQFIFLSKGEIDFAIQKYTKYKDKFHYSPFAVDLDIWKKKNKKEEEYILFVGNDGFRNYELVEKLTNKLSEKKFIIVSEQINKEKLSSNSEVINGSWGDPEVNDLELRDIYQKAKLTIIPLKDSLQPSGQSVALQSIACGTPVIISETEGFWDPKNFVDNENIFFVKDNSLDNWVSLIEKVYYLELDVRNELVNSGLKTIKENYDLNNFSKKIEEIIIKK